MTEPKHVRKFRERHLKANECLVAWADGFSKATAHTVVLIVTDQRVALYRGGWLGELLETIELAKITSVERKSTLGYRTTVLHTSHDAMEFSTFEATQDRAVHVAIEAGRDAGSAKKPSAEPLAALKALAELKAAGVLSEQEFEAKKIDLLKRV